MAERVLLVTGARALSLSAAAVEWARVQIRRVLRAFDPTLVEHGACPHSPDHWSHEEAQGRRRRAFYADGRTRDFDEAGVGGPWGSWLSDKNPTPGPTRRNPVMVDDVRAAVDLGAEAYALALTAFWSQTRGTMRTVLLAHEAGLRIELCPCPREFAPRGLA